MRNVESAIEDAVREYAQLLEDYEGAPPQEEVEPLVRQFRAHAGVEDRVLAAFLQAADEYFARHPAKV